MEFWKTETEYAAGVDLHWDNMVVCVTDRQGDTHVHRRLRNNPKTFRRVIAPYAHSVTVAVESTGNWYWLGDLCEDMGVPFVLGHALYMKWIHGSKAKDDYIDSEKLARMLMGGTFPRAYAHPRELRATRDLLRRRGRFVSMRSGMLSHLRLLNAQANMDPLGGTAKSSEKRSSIPQTLEDPDMRMSAEADAVTADYYDSIVTQIERHVLERTKEHRTRELALLMTTPGIGKILALTIALEIHDIARFGSRQKFCAYCRLVTSRHVSNGRAYGSAGRKIGNPYLKWAFGEVACFASNRSAGINALKQKLAKRHGPGRALSVLAHKFGRAVYYMLKNGTVFDEQKFLAK